MPRKTLKRIIISAVATFTVIAGAWLLAIGAHGPAADANPPSASTPVVDISGPNNATPIFDSGASRDEQGSDDDGHNGLEQEHGGHDD